MNRGQKSKCARPSKKNHRGQEQSVKGRKQEGAILGRGSSAMFSDGRLGSLLWVWVGQGLVGGLHHSRGGL